MDNAQFLGALSSEGAAFARTAASVGLDKPVASCPGWTVGDLVRHLSGVHAFWASVVASRAQRREQIGGLERVDDDDLLATYDATLDRLVKALDGTDPTTAVWTWSTAHDVAFVTRRMAQETAVHRWDVDQAAGHSVAIDGVLASDGIDEFLEHFLPAFSGGAEPLGGSVHLHCADVPGEWMVRQTPDGRYDVTREHAKGDCALRGGAADLLLALWRRAESIEIVGDVGLARRFLERTRLG